MRLTRAKKLAPGKASSSTSASWPTLTSGMSVSSTSAATIRVLTSYTVATVCPALTCEPARSGGPLPVPAPPAMLCSADWALSGREDTLGRPAMPPDGVAAVERPSCTVPDSGARKVSAAFCWFARSRASWAWLRCAAVAAPMALRSAAVCWLSAPAAACAAAPAACWAAAIRRAAWSRLACTLARCVAGSSGRAARRASSTAPLLAETCCWSWLRAARAAPVGRLGTAPSSDEAAASAACAWRIAAST